MQEIDLFWETKANIKNRKIVPLQQAIIEMSCLCHKLN